jgi:hypothetical protein
MVQSKSVHSTVAQEGLGDEVRLTFTRRAFVPTAAAGDRLLADDFAIKQSTLKIQLGKIC